MKEVEFGGIDAAMDRIRHKLERARAAREKDVPSDPREVLRERARALAAAPRTAGEEGERVAVIEFYIGRESFAFESRWVKEVFVLPHLVRVPCTPPFIAGVVNLRGTILSIVDLRRLLGLAEDGGEMDNVLLLSDGAMEFGVLAARVEEARELLRKSLSPPLSTLPAAAQHFQRGVFPGPVSLLDAPLLLASPEMHVDGGGTSTP